MQVIVELDVLHFVLVDNCGDPFLDWLEEPNLVNLPGLWFWYHNQGAGSCLHQDNPSLECMLYKLDDEVPGSWCCFFIGMPFLEVFNVHATHTQCFAIA